MSPKAKAPKSKRPGKPPKARAPRKARNDRQDKKPQEKGPLEPEVLEPEAVEAEPPDEGPAAENTLPVPVERDLARADALQRYMAEVAKHALLSREEEHELAVKFQRTHDPEIAYRLVTANLRLVVKIAHEYRRAAFSLLDLIQEGNVGLMQAVQKYDPFRGVKLSSYAAWWIRAYILRYLMDNWRMVKLGTTQAQRKLFFNLRKEQEKLLAQGFEAAPKLLAERLDVTEQDVREMDQRLSNDEFSIDAPVAVGGQDEGRQTHGDRLVQTAPPVDEQLADEELRRIFKEKLAEFGKTLTADKDRFLFENRIAPPDDREPMTLQQIGDLWGVTRERARQLEARLTDRLRDYLRRELPDFAQLSVTPAEES
ncbi:MAG: sigma-70 family RNA polymerase sigma factor [Deltaproteobacteria bacterium]|nr:MAG: sigma-70 family RNA polymerase sigma factor [Deltaproteobacteria bacterium]TMB33816.1 MAG: sigma-70 family RNA polymerase sigma factor [Deltaproteobacteria bacterium]